MVDAIHPEGDINDNECMQCMHCQVLYKDKDKCPEKAKLVKREARHQEQRDKKLKKVEIENL